MRYGLHEVPRVPEVPQQADVAGNVIEPDVPAIAPLPGIQATPIPERCASRLLVASIAWNYYHDTGRDSTHNNMHF